MQRCRSWAVALAAIVPWSLLCVASAAELPFATAIPDRIIWVSPDGSDSNTGAVESPIRSIQLAIDRAAPGTAILLKPGSYLGNLEFPSIQGTPDKPIWLAAANGPGTVTITAASGAKPVIGIFGEDNIVIRDLTVSKGYSGIQVSQSGSNYTNLANNILIEGNTITASVVDGLKISQTNNVHIINNVINGAGGEGIDALGVTGAVISGNEISNVTGTSAGLFVKGGSSGIIIADNYIHNVAGDGLLVGGWTSKGSFLPGTSYEAKDVVATGNVVDYAGKRPLAVLGAQNVDISASKFGATAANTYAVAIGPGSPELSPPPPSSNVSIHNNVFEPTKYFSQVLSGSTNIVFADNVKNGVVDGDMRAPIAHSAPLADVLPADLLSAFTWPTTGRSRYTVNGTSGADTLTGTTVGDYLAGGSGADTMKGGAGDDSYEIGSPKDVIVENAGAGADAALVWASSYVLPANAENLIVKASTGGTFTGNALNNILVSGRGDEVLAGGAGDDLFAFAPGSGHDKVADLTPGALSRDTIDLTAFTKLVSLSDVLALASQSGANTVLSFATGETLTLANVNLDDLTADDFLLTRVPPPPNGAPTAIAISASTVAEDAAIGTVVGTLSATDPDPNETFAYTLTDNPSGLFAVDGDNLVVASALGAAAPHDIVVRVTDSVNHTFDQALTIDVTPAPLPALSAVSAATTSLLSDARISAVPGGTVLTPSSSIARATDTGRFVHTMYVVYRPNGVASPVFPTEAVAGRVAPPVAGYRVETPASLACIYGLTVYVAGCNPDTLTAHAVGGSRVVVVTIAFHYPTALADLTRFSAQFGLPVPDLTVVPLGSPPVNSGWNLEAALDLDMIHSMAPNARLILVEAPSNSVTDMMEAVDVGRAYAEAAGGGQVNGSWGGNEFSAEQVFDTHFTGNKVTYFFSSGDSVSPSWPAASSKVVAVGGTSTPRNATTGLYVGLESSWTSAGVGLSAYVARPGFQNSIAAKVGARRAIPDISADANPATGVWVHYNNGWYIVGGTSVSSPMVAGMVNRAAKFRADSQAQNAYMYANVGTAAFFHDVGRGRCGPQSSYATTAGAKTAAWDLCTGIGSPKGAAGL